MNLYRVESPGGFPLEIEAKDSRSAKREYCRRTGRKPSDHWSGIGVLTARKLKPDEVTPETRARFHRVYDQAIEEERERRDSHDKSLQLDEPGETD